MNDTVIIILLSVNLVLTLVAVIALLLSKKGGGLTRREAETIVKGESDYQTRAIQNSMNATNATLLNALRMHTEAQGSSTDRFLKMVSENLERQEISKQEFIKTVESRLEAMKNGLEKTLAEVRRENTEQMDKMRVVVEEKMQATLTERINQSFEQIGKQLDSLREGLGEMKALTDGVSDLKKVLNGVKPRGVWGEISLGSLIGEILAPEQYETNAKIGKKGEVVEYAIKMPENGEESVLLPIDAKFPLEDYQRLVEASENGDKVQVEMAGGALERRIKEEAKTISDKYRKPPQTTDFAVMYLPIEGLYAEVARRPELLDLVHNKYHVLVTGPTTLAALLNSLLVGFRTVAIQKHSREIWKLLATFRTEFVRFAELLEKTQGYAEKTSDGIRDVTQKTFKIQKKLSQVEFIDQPEENNDEFLE